ncbi:outer membrane protein assembly factor BamB family protein [Cellulomonas soli]|uniref:Pyrrolo-quinoline quinone repeat domain-containing protein n=1 Tax=Cellulomonas soli TaxID=931535 RepID=A0A512PDA2_9CELL|nr:PQQ-binding-like beta-propeller repeat protein [Cellulomonas soli]NYI60160.1 outer membrane protein assembly factor BamB [Cellulomonas soli]GEP69187.1 hypothetical protein CSO01_19020 [Cellulomonas soli]
MRPVPVDETDEPDEVETAGVRPRSGPERLGAGVSRVRGWAATRPRRAAELALVALVLVAATVVAVPAGVTAWERHQVTRPAAFAGGVQTLAAPPAVRWMVSYDETVAPVLAGDVVVVAGWSTGRRALVGLDVVTGARRWTVPLDARPDEDAVLCTVVEEPRAVVCAVGAPREPAPGDLPAETEQDPAGLVGARTTVLVLDPATGAVRRAVGLDGMVLVLEPLGADVVLGRVEGGVVAVERLAVASGRRRWVSVVRSSASMSVPHGMRLEAHGERVLIVGVGAVRVLDARTGDPQTVDPGQGGADVVRLRPDGTLVRIRYELQADGIEVTSTLVRADGSASPGLRGVLVEPSVADGSSGLLFTASTLAADPYGGRVRAYDQQTGQEVWRAPVHSSAVDADVGGVVVLRGSGTFVGVDAGTGERLWWRPVGLGVVSVQSDGQRMLVVRRLPGEGTVVEAIGLRSGDLVWEASTPRRVDTVLRLGGLLYGSGDGLLVALR